MNRRAFLKTLGLGAVALGTTKYFDMGASWKKRGKLYEVDEMVLTSEYDHLRRQFVHEDIALTDAILAENRAWDDYMHRAREALNFNPHPKQIEALWSENCCVRVNDSQGIPPGTLVQLGDEYYVADPNGSKTMKHSETLIMSGSFDAFRIFKS